VPDKHPTFVLMKKIAFIIPAGKIKLSSLFGAMEIFEHANNFYASNNKKTYYQVEVIGTDLPQSLVHSELSLTTPSYKLAENDPDLIIIPGVYENINYASSENKNLLEWMVEKHKAGCQLASLCTGAFMLASTGLLNGKDCTTHWAAEKLFMERFPEVRLCTDKLITDQNGIYTAAGANSSLNLILYLLNKFNGHETALYCSKILQLDIGRDSQLPFMIFKGQRNHEDQTIKDVQEFIEGHIDERITVEFLADKFAISKRNFIRRFKKATKSLPIEYIQKTKVEAAKQSLELNRKNVNEVMYSVGYTDIKAFRTIFRKLTGYSPTEYQQKFSASFN
jgi:transcriptional regulator GlxA family with amidase domain